MDHIRPHSLLFMETDPHAQIGKTSFASVNFPIISCEFISDRDEFLKPSPSFLRFYRKKALIAPH